MDPQPLKQIIEGCLMASDRPLGVDHLVALFEPQDGDKPSRDAVRRVVAELQADCDGRGIELVEVASGFRYQAREALAPWVNRLWEERKPRYSRALLETVAIIAYRQPITRGEIENIRGVAVSSGIIRTLIERDWVRVVGHRDVPGRPAVFATTKEFLDYFCLKSLSDLPSLAELKDIGDLNADLFADQDLTGDGGGPDPGEPGSLLVAGAQTEVDLEEAGAEAPLAVLAAQTVPDEAAGGSHPVHE